MRQLIITLILLSLASKANAIGYSLHFDSVLELQLSKQSPTRVIIEEEKITDIFVYPQEAAEVVVHSSGCLMVLPQVGVEKIFITIFGENGTVQDLSLRFVEKNPAPIRLIKFNMANEVTNNKINNNKERK